MKARQQSKIAYYCRTCGSSYNDRPAPVEAKVYLKPNAFLGEKMVNYEIPRELRPFVQAVQSILEEANVSVTDQGISLRGLDPSHIEMAELTIHDVTVQPESAPEVYRVNMDTLSKALKKGFGNLNFDMASKKLVLSNGNRKITVPTLEPSTEDVPEPKLPTPETVATIDSTELTAAEGIVTYDTIRLTGDGAKITAHVAGDLSSYDAIVGTCEKDSKPFSVSVNYNYFESFLQLDSGRFEFLTAYPVKATFTQSSYDKRANAKLVLWLAPRIEAEDGPKSRPATPSTTSTQAPTVSTATVEAPAVTAEEPESDAETEDDSDENPSTELPALEVS